MLSCFYAFNYSKQLAGVEEALNVKLALVAELRAQSEFIIAQDQRNEMEQLQETEQRLLVELKLLQGGTGEERLEKRHKVCREREREGEKETVCVCVNCGTLTVVE